jgi:hypothetical protein
MSRPGAGVEHVEKLDGEVASKERLKAILATLSGAMSVEEACAALSLSPSRFHALREAALCGALEALSPRASGRPRSVPEVTPAEAALRAENADLRHELETMRIRTEIALLFPHLVRPPKGGEKGGDTRPDGGRRST